MAASDNLGGQFAQQQLFDPGPAIHGPSRPAPEAAPHEPFSGGRRISQAALPNAIPVRDVIFPSLGGMTRVTELPNVHKEVPIDRVSTEQHGLYTSRLNEVWQGQNLPEDGYATHRPLAWEHRHPTDPSQNEYTLHDGNHRSTVEKHRGAMFLPVKVNRSGPMEDQPQLNDGAHSSIKGKGRFDP